MKPLVPITLVLLAFAILLRIDLLFAVVWFLAGIYLLSRLWSRVAARNLRVSRNFTDHAFFGDVVTVDLVVLNTGRWPVPWVELEESMPVALRHDRFPPQVISLGPHRRRRFSYQLVCRKRGLHRIGPARANTGDVLGVEDRAIALPEARTLTVYPRIVTLERLGLPTRSALVALPAITPLFEDPARVIGVREYVPGDSPRRIHWTASSHLGRMMVKQYQPAIARETLICLDLDLRDYERRERYQAAEMAIVTAASLAHHIVVREGLPVGLSVLGRDPQTDERPATLPPHAARPHLIQLLEILARIDTVTEGRMATLLRQEALRLAWGSTVVVIAGQLDDDLTSMLAHLKRSGHAVTAILIQTGTLLDTGLAGAGIPIYRVWVDQDLAAV